MSTDVITVTLCIISYCRNEYNVKKAASRENKSTSICHKEVPKIKIWSRKKKVEIMTRLPTLYPWIQLVVKCAFLQQATMMEDVCSPHEQRNISRLPERELLCWWKKNKERTEYQSYMPVTWQTFRTQTSGEQVLTEWMVPNLNCT